tara:strand:+ start:202 stop:504 length:303 start_codon:yes stop_codon:yes gene_type:complete
MINLKKLKIIVPNHIIKIEIFSYLRGKCSKCNNEFFTFELSENCTLNKYLNIFDQDYDFPHVLKKYKYLCENCKSNYVQLKEKNSRGEIVLLEFCIDNNI